MSSFYVETYRAENTGLGHDVRFPAHEDAERAARDLLSLRPVYFGKSPTVEVSAEPPTTTYRAWNEAGW